MRTLIALLTLGAGGAGYAYLQQTPASGEPYFQRSSTRSASELNLAAVSKLDSTRGSVKELVSHIHEHTKSILDDFANQHGGHSDAPADNAYQRLKQVTHSTDIAFGNGNEGSLGETAGRNQLRSPPPKLDELQRLAFDPAVIVDPASDPLPAIQVAAGSVEPASELEQMELRAEPKVSTGKPEVSSVSTAAPKTKRPVATMVSGTSPKSVPVEWKVIGKTTERRPMHSMHLGNSGTRTLVIAGIDGRDRVAVRWLEQMAESLASRPALLTNNEVLFLRAGNPDGLVHNAKDNSRGVPLNRNFPSRRYRPTSGLPSFAVPASEVETRVILDSLYTFRPRRVIYLVATSAPTQVQYNRSGKEVAELLERSAKLRIVPLDAEQVPGSIEDFADGTLEAAVLSMKLNVGNDWQKTWTALQPQILSAVVGRSTDSDESETVAPFDPDRSPLPVPNVEPISRRRGRRGYEQLPAPPQY